MKTVVLVETCKVYRVSEKMYVKLKQLIQNYKNTPCCEIDLEIIALKEHIRDNCKVIADIDSILE